MEVGVLEGGLEALWSSERRRMRKLGRGSLTLEKKMKRRRGRTLRSISTRVKTRRQFREENPVGRLQLHRAHRHQQREQLPVQSTRYQGWNSVKDTVKDMGTARPGAILLDVPVQVRPSLLPPRLQGPPWPILVLGPILSDLG